MATLNLSALTDEEKAELRYRLEKRAEYEAMDAAERAKIEENARLEADLAAFIKAAWHVVRPGIQLDWSWHYDLMCEHLTLVYERKTRRLIINVSPRSLKSLIVTVMFPVWVWTKQPSHSLACASYAANLSTEHSVLRRNLIESDWFKARWGDKVWLEKDQNEKTKFKNNHQAQMIATSVGGTATGLGGNTLIVDDGLNPKQANSEAERKTAHDWFDNTWRSRMNNPAEDALIVIEQRTGELDITGHLLEADKVLVTQGKKPEWTHLSIPLECDEEDGLTEYKFPISGRVVERKVGDVLQPTRFPPPVVAALKVLRIVWSTQYQQRPSPLEGNLIKRSEVRYYGGIDPITGAADPVLPPKFDLIVTSADCTFKDTDGTDFVAIVTVGAIGPDRCVLEITNKRLDEPATTNAIIQHQQRWKSTVVLVEDKANGPAVIKNLKRKISGVVAVEPMGGKMARMYAMSGEWQGGNWYLDRNGPLTELAIEQLTKFPAAKNDDVSDSLSQASIYLQGKGFRYGLTEFYRKETEDMARKGEAKFKKPRPTNLADAIENADTIAPLPEVQEPHEIGKVSQPSMVKPATDDSTLRCPNPDCGSTFLQRIPGGLRCGQCATQIMRNQLNKPAGQYEGLVRK